MVSRSQAVSREHIFIYDGFKSETYHVLEPVGFGLAVLAGGLGCVGFCFLLVLGFIMPLRKQSRASFALQDGLSVLAISDLQLAALASLQVTEPVHGNQASVWVVESVYRR